MTETQCGADTIHRAIKKYKGHVLPCVFRGVRAAMQGSREISRFLLLVSQGGNSCRPHWEVGGGHGYR